MGFPDEMQLAVPKLGPIMAVGMYGLTSLRAATFPPDFQGGVACEPAAGAQRLLEESVHAGLVSLAGCGRAIGSRGMTRGMTRGMMRGMMRRDRYDKIGD